ncbi:cell filamentation protein Fic [Tessaracoccus aquimaris]|uniref:Cell filamentation protein Fic n=1 Tax=Tessaracoccus aquimaris TaxID=1332264 RepID=A0A1Q2CQV3_9ACTN|nr:Fic family protein [Tessaracoccus aquimaris]AQP48482.1 cell filamentation protein Fic [Tessaracoccus aquimaris]
MATWEEAHWESSVDSGTPKAERQAGAYHRYAPDFVDGIGLAVDGDLSRIVSRVERNIRALNGPGAEGLAGIARFLLRSEAIASSRIEGIAPSAQQVALAELGQSETVRGVSEQAKLVANNMTIVREATTKLVEAEAVTVQDVVELHRSLMPDEPRHHGLREVQNWIGVSRWTPIGAAFVPPDPAMVPGLMGDLTKYLNGAAHSPLIQAAVVHAHFETIHPFTDGNGRVGRALIHTVLARRGLTEDAVLPISLVLATLRDRYVSGLSSFRHASPAGSPEANRATNAWLETFVGAAEIAVEQSESLVRQIEALRGEWTERLTSHRTATGMRPVPRADSATARLLAQLTEAPVVSATTLAKILGVSYPAASGALDELRQAGILIPRSIERGATAYIAREVLDLVTFSERALASTQFDTLAAQPDRPVPARPRRN